MTRWIVPLPKDKWRTCPVCNGTNSVYEGGDAHRSSGYIPCPSIVCGKGLVVSEIVEKRPKPRVRVKAGRRAVDA